MDFRKQKTEGKFQTTEFRKQIADFKILLSAF